MRPENLLTIAGIWRADADNVFFKPDQVVMRRELAGSLVRLIRSLPETKDWPALPTQPRFTDVPSDDADRAFIETMITWGEFGLQRLTFQPDEAVTWGTLDRWLAALKLPIFKTPSYAKTKSYPLTRAECVDYLYRGGATTRRAFGHELQNRSG